MAPPLLSLTDVNLTFGGTPLLTGAEIAVGPGEKVALVGRNGSGKSTLLRIAAGMIEPDSGIRFVQPGATIQYLPQEPDLAAFGNTLAYVEAGLGPGQEPYRAQYLLNELGLSGEETPSRLSGGEARRAALARVLAPEPDILLLDEPTNHLDLPAIEWLEEELKGLRSALVIISHDRRFLADLTRTTVWLDRGVTRRLGQGFGAFEAWRDDVLATEEQSRHKLDRKIAAEEDWVRYGVTARRKRNVRRMAELQELRQARRTARGPAGNVSISVSEGRTSGAIVVDAENISKAYGQRVVVRNLTTRVIRGDRLGIVGPNGAGKTTLLKLLTGELSPDSGNVRLGSNLEIAMLDQSRARLGAETTLKDALTGGHGDTVIINGQQRHFAGYMKDFLFSPEQAGTPLGRLSGGERARVALARALALPSNLLVLDEPTNDLDLETLDLLQEMVGDYKGTAIVVSHDRDFLDRVATSVIVSDGDGHWTEYAGGYSDMVSQRGYGVRAPSSKPELPARKEPAPAPAPAAQQKRRLSFKDKHALETLPAQIAELTARIDRIERELADPGLYGRDPAAFERLSESLDAARAERAEKEDRWLELELAREEIEGQAGRP